MNTCSKNARDVADVLKNVNTFFGGNVWTPGEITNVSNKITCNPFGDLKEILNIAVIKPLNRRPDLVMTYKNNGGAENDNSYSLAGLAEVDTINFGSTPGIEPNREQGINGRHFRESLQLLNLNSDNTAENALRAYAVYYDDSANSVSSSDYAYYLVTGGNGIFDGAQRVRIDFNKDKTRKVTVMFK